MSTILLNDFKANQIAEILSSPDWYKFCFVRNPYHRFISAYKSKIGNFWERQYEWIQEEIREIFNYPTRSNQKPIIAFRDFARYLSKRPESAWHDGHFTSQTNILTTRLVRYDFIGRFERFPHDMQSILNRLGASPETIKIAKEIRNPTQWTLAPWLYDEELADLIYDLYKDDFERFGYEKDSWLFPKLDFDSSNRPLE